jgi:hypothetical protein
MKRLSSTCALVFVLSLAACGSSIGDSCEQALDCAQDGSRICDVSSKGGYCTIEGCNLGTCPDEAICVRFFPVANLTVACGDGCAIDEHCTTANLCAPLSLERRFCMLSCDDNSDCRDDYECRNPTSSTRGGEPVPDPDSPSASRRKFCAPLSN